MSPITIERVCIPLRDGVRLAGFVYRSRIADMTGPCVCTLTPYTADFMHTHAVYFAQQGFTFVVVDVRGRGDSEGQFRPNIQEAQDGHDVIEWIARQSFCPGRVGMWGASYSGYAQWATVKEGSMHLGSLVPTAAPFLGVDFPMCNNVAHPYIVQWLALVSGRASHMKKFADAAAWAAEFRDWTVAGEAFEALDRYADAQGATFREWLQHPELGAYWDAYNPSAAQYAALRLPILTITGSYDDDQAGALEHYRQHMTYGRADGRTQHYLIIGPWDHAGTMMPQREFGGLRCGPAALVDLRQLQADWYRWTLGDGPKPSFLQQRVAYYVMGAEQWRYADSLESITASREPLYLDSRSGACDVFESGALQSRVGEGAADSYVFDPRDVSGPEIDAEYRADGSSLTDATLLHALRGRSLVYHSAPLQAPLEVSGFFRLTCWMSIDAPDTDFYVSVHEITAGGASIRLATDVMRARYREGLHRAVLVESTAPLCYDFKRFTFISREIPQGHRLRLVIAPWGRLMGTPFVQRNFQGGGVVARETRAQGRAVTVRLFHDAAHPNVLWVPRGAAHDARSGAG